MKIGFVKQGEDYSFKYLIEINQYYCIKEGHYSIMITK